LGALRDGAHTEYVAVPFAQANMAKIPDEVSDEQALFVGDLISVAFAASETAGIRMGDTVTIFGQGPIGLAATVGAKLNGAGFIITVDTLPMRIEMSRKMGADVALDATKVDVISEIRKLTDGWMADVSMEIVGKPETFLNALKATRPAGVLSSIGNYGFKGSLPLPLDAFLAGVGDIKIVTTASPGGKDRVRRLLNMIQHGKFDLTSLITHRFPLDQIEKAYKVFRGDKNKVLKVTIKP
jgi:threonine dehydrogenase-like Zn-dependent dehydrogenase